MSQVTTNGNTYSDDGTTAKDMLGKGYATHFLPMLSDTMVEVGNATTAAANALADRNLAQNYSAALQATSTTSNSIGTGAKTFTVAAGKQFAAGQYVLVQRTGTSDYMWGTVTSYTTTSLVLSIQLTAGSGTYTTWTISLSGARGATGTQAPMTLSDKTANYTAVLSDIGNILSFTGTYTLSLTAAATLGAGWYCYVRNAGTGAITIDPNSAELINGAATYTVAAGQHMLLRCTGTAFTVITETPARLIKCKILSPEAANLDAMSCLETLENRTAATGLAEQPVFVGYDATTALFYASSDSPSSYIATSPDGDTWTLRTMPSNNYWRVTTTTAGWLAVVTGGTATASSTNGQTWASATSVGGIVENPVALGARIFAQGYGTTTSYYTDNLGVSWAAATTPIATSSLYNAASIASVFIICNSTTTYYTSTTGATGSWTSRTAPANMFYYKLFEDGKLYVANNTQTSLYVSTDGITFNTTGLSFPQSWPTAVLNGKPVTLLKASYSKSQHNGKTVMRSSGIDANRNYATNGTGKYIFGGQVGNVAIIDPSASDAAVGLFAGA